jgi:NAD(P)-dependent dehydrogenase (short-subunit alcohol dehydrogenase family)
MRSLVREIQDSGAIGRTAVIVEDVAAEGAPRRIVMMVEETLGPVDILINNAGISRTSPMSLEDMDAWWRVYEVNVKAPVSLCREVLPSMVKRQTGVVISTSALGTMDPPAMSAYASSKMALSKFHELLAKELEAESPRTRSFAVYPGFIWTGIGSRPHEINDDAMQHPAMQKLFSIVSGMDMSAMKTQTPQLCADTMVALAADPEYAILTGYHINAPQELPRVLEEAKKNRHGRIGAERLHVVKIATL